jgi:hypothetical protein
MSQKQKVKILFVDIETSPILGYVWGLWDNDLALNQVKQDWHLLSFAAKWMGDKPSEIIYADQRNAKDITNDKKLLEKIWKLLDEADIVIGQNSKAFDVKKLNARFILNGMQPPSSFRQIDTMVLAKKYFAFSSNKLEFLTSNLCTKYKKLSHKKFPGFSLWSECLKGNKEAWKEMQLYNCHDTLATEELYQKLAAWDTSINFDAYTDDLNHTCTCGHKEFENKGYAYTSGGKFQRFKCKACGKESRGRANLLGIDKRRSMRR